jgi:hypothetical protein
VQFCRRSDREEDVPAADAIAFDRKVTEEDRYGRAAVVLSSS